MGLYIFGTEAVTKGVPEKRCLQKTQKSLTEPSHESILKKRRKHLRWRPFKNKFAGQVTAILQQTYGGLLLYLEKDT